ncbi:MAG: formamidopyrimidine-DNA glycosylase [Rickettsiales bacterium]|nr:formamidopyrimidine-DNA glycosylase [Rickettsiales bacterium]
MPELPEVETVRKFLEKNIVGEKTLKINIKNKKLRYEISSKINDKLSDSIITKISRRGKYLIFFYSNEQILLIHLGMTGYFRITKKINKKKHDHIIFYFKEKNLIFNDIRKFGFIKIYMKSKFDSCTHLKKIGPEPLSREFNDVHFKKNISTTATIKSLLMNQKFVAGLGNIYCSEILFDARIHPERIPKNLNRKEIKRIISSIKKILTMAIKVGGTTIKNFIVSDEKVGYFRNKLKVYGRLNQSCMRCKSNHKVQKIIQNGRSSFFCINCQL